jgi:adenylate cyclase
MAKDSVTETVKRRLAAILAADVVGYSRLIGEDESGTLASLHEIFRSIVNPVLAEHGGRIFKRMGDGMLAEFPSAVQALRAAISIQGRLGQRNRAACSRRMEVRIGLHQGDVVIEGSDLFGDGVNIAARLEPLAEPGGICISGRVYEDAAGKITFEAQDIGEQSLKNIARKVRAYRISVGSTQSNEHGRTDSATLPLPDKPSLAVLPFQNMSGEPEQEYFADGMVDEIITALSRVRSFFVIARNSSFTYKGKAIDVKQVGRDLGVRYVLEGSVRKAGNRLRIIGQLIDATTGAHIWADRFDGGLDDVFDLQDQIAARVVGAIAPKLEQAEIERIKRAPTANLNAYDCYLRGTACTYTWTKDGYDEALRLFYKAIELDPDFAAAYASAASCYSFRKTNGSVTDKEYEIAEATRLARRAVELGKDDAFALSFAGFSLAYLAGDLDDGAVLIDRALQFNPNLARAWSASAWVRLWLGEPEIAIEHHARAMRLSPLDPAFLHAMQTATAQAHFFAGRHDEALAWAEKAVQEQPNSGDAFSILAASSALAGLPEKAQKAIARLLQVNPTWRISNIADRIPKYRRPKYYDMLVDGLRRAGLPE